MSLGNIDLGQHGETHKIRGSVVFPKIRSHAVEAAVIHQIRLLKAGLAADDVGCRHQRRTVGGNKPVREGRCCFIGQLGGPAEDRKTGDGNHQQDPLENIADRILGLPIKPCCRYRGHA